MLNKVFLLGTIGDKGVSVRFLEESGTRCASFLLKLTESGTDGRTFTSYHLVECFGKALEVAETLEAGDPVLLDGKLRRRKVGADRYETGVLALGLSKVALPALGEVSHV